MDNPEHAAAPESSLQKVHAAMQKVQEARAKRLARQAALERLVNALSQPVLGL